MTVQRSASEYREVKQCDSSLLFTSGQWLPAATCVQKAYKGRPAWTDFYRLQTFGQFLLRIVSVSLEGGLINLSYTALRKLLSASLFLYFLEKMGSKLEKKNQQ